MEKPVNPIRALQIALEDRATAHFIQTSFSRPDEYPRILSIRWLSEEGPNSVWNIVIVERPPGGRVLRPDLINAIYLEVDSVSGAIVSRKYFRNISGPELQRVVKRELDILRGGCKDPSW